MEIPAIDESDNQFTERYVFLTYTDVAVVDEVSVKDGLEFNVTQDQNMKVLDFFEDGVLNAIP